MNTYPCKAPEGLFTIANYQVPTHPADVDLNSLKSRCARVFDTTVHQMRSKTRKKEVVWARQVCMLMLVYKHHYNQRKAGGVFHVDRTTVIHARKAITNLIETDPAFAEKIDAISPILSYRLKAVAKQAA